MNTHTSLRKLNNREPGLYNSDLKLIAIITMIIDHIGACVVSCIPAVQDPNSMVYMLYWVLRIIGRIAFPIFCFLLVEGFIHSKNRYKYALRLLIYSVISEVPFDLALTRHAINWSHQNVFFTLLLGLLSMMVLDLIQQHSKDLSELSFGPKFLLKYSSLLLAPVYFSYKTVSYLKKYSNISVNEWILYVALYLGYVVLMFIVLNKISIKESASKALIVCTSISTLAIFMFIADMAHTDYSGAGILTIVLMYMARGNYYLRIVYGCVALSALSNPVELVTFATIPVVLKYNGKRGSGIKQLFYAIYPLHLLILYAIAKLALY